MASRSSGHRNRRRNLIPGMHHDRRGRRRKISLYRNRWRRWLQGIGMLDPLALELREVYKFTPRILRSPIHASVGTLPASLLTRRNGRQRLRWENYGALWECRRRWRWGRRKRLRKRIVRRRRGSLRTGSMVDLRLEVVDFVLIIVEHAGQMIPAPAKINDRISVHDCSFSSAT